MRLLFAGILWRLNCDLVFNANYLERAGYGLSFDGRSRGNLRGQSADCSGSDGPWQTCHRYLHYPQNYRTIYRWLGLPPFNCLAGLNFLVECASLSSRHYYPFVDACFLASLRCMSWCSTDANATAPVDHHRTWAVAWGPKTVFICSYCGGSLHLLRRPLHWQWH